MYFSIISAQETLDKIISFMNEGQAPSGLKRFLPQRKYGYVTPHVQINNEWKARIKFSEFYVTYFVLS